MKRTLSFMVMALSLLLTQCRKPEVKTPSPAAPEGTTVSMTVTAGPGSKTDITTAGGITWSAGDKLYVGHNNAYVGYLTIVSGQNTPTGTFSGDVTLAGITEGVEQTFGFFYLGSAARTLAVGATSAVVDFSSQNIYADNGKLKNAGAQHVGYGTAKGTVANGIVTGINVTLVSKVALAYFCFQKGEGESATPYTGTLTLSGTNIYNSMTVGFGGSFTGNTKGNISLIGSHSERYVMLVPTNSTAAETLNFGGMSDTTTLENGIEANKFYGRESAIVVKVKPVFSVDANGTTVEFAPGNLQYLGKSDGNGTWRFAEHQWDVLGAGPSAASNKGNVDLGTEYTGKYNTGSGKAGPNETQADKASARDLFGWGATGFQDTRANTYQTNFKPYSTSNSSVSGGSAVNNYGYGPDYDGNKYGLSVDAKSDWGCVAIGGDPAETWRTLNSAEWVWLLNTGGSSGRTDANRFAKAKVNGVNGLLVFPDGYNGGTAIGSIMGVAALNTTDAAYPADDILETTWTEMESAGVVFLPAAGRRIGSSLYDVGSQGGYWSSACPSKGDAYRMYFYSGGVNPQIDNYRYCGFSVRLVR